jgi:carbon-monoxide dehydrogenase small subunit
MILELTVNGEQRRVEAEPRMLLVQLLRETLGLTGTKVGCESSICGACTVLLDGRPVKSCTVLAVQAYGAAVTTVEGLGAPGALSPEQEAFRAEHGLQCGYCTPGMIVSVTALLDRHDDPTDDEIRHALEGNLCRCTGYVGILRAVRYAAALRRGERPEPEAGQARADPVARREVVAGPVSGEDMEAV